MNVKKKAPKKRKYVKKSQAQAENINSDNKELLGLILEGVNRLGAKEKANVLAHILKGRRFSENELWAIERILS
jgi:hypothetical protein